MFISKNIFHQTVVIFPVMMQDMIAGIGYGWMAPTLKLMYDPESDFALSSDECSWMAGMQFIGRTMGPLLAMIFLDKIGRKNMLIFSAVIFGFMWIIVMCTKSILLLYGVRLVFGMGVGTMDSVSSIYICENCSPNIRGVFSSIVLSFFFFGELVAFILGTFLEYNAVAIVYTVIGILTFCTIFVLKEPAQFLIQTGQDKKAEENFFWLRGTDMETKKEFEEMKLYLYEEKSKFSSKLLFKNVENRRCLTVVFISHLLLYSTGFAALNSYVSIAFSNSGTPRSNELTILYGFFVFLGVCITSFNIERFGRRTLLLTASVGSAFLHAISGLLYYIEENIQELPFFPWLIFATITSYSAIFAMIMSPLSGTIRGELLPQSVKAIGTSLAVMSSSAISFVTSKIFLILSESYGVQPIFFFFSFISVISALYLYLRLPETKGLTLVEIQKTMKT